MKVAPWRKGTVDRDNAWSRLGESNPGPTHYENDLTAVETC